MSRNPFYIRGPIPTMPSVGVGLTATMKCRNPFYIRGPIPTYIEAALKEIGYLSGRNPFYIRGPIPTAIVPLKECKIPTFVAIPFTSGDLFQQEDFSLDNSDFLSEESQSLLHQGTYSNVLKRD